MFREHLRNNYLSITCRLCGAVNNPELDVTSMKRPNPNNPMEYCSTIPPLLQVGPTQSTPPSVLVPVLKREGKCVHRSYRPLSQLGRIALHEISQFRSRLD